jgi:hypothetical protein
LVEVVAFLPLSGAFFSGGAFFGREGRCFFVGGEEEEEEAMVKMEEMME